MFLATVKTSIKKAQLEVMVQFVQPRNLYTALESDPASSEKTRQLAVLTFFSELAKYGTVMWHPTPTSRNWPVTTRLSMVFAENNQRELAEMNFLRTLFVYFLPLTKSGSHYKFDYQTIYLVVVTIQSLVQESPYWTAWNQAHFSNIPTSGFQRWES